MMWNLILLTDWYLEFEEHQAAQDGSLTDHEYYGEAASQEKTDALAAVAEELGLTVVKTATNWTGSAYPCDCAAKTGNSCNWGSDRCFSLVLAQSPQDLMGLDERLVAITAERGLCIRVFDMHSMFTQHYEEGDYDTGSIWSPENEYLKIIEATHTHFASVFDGAPVLRHKELGMTMDPWGKCSYGALDELVQKIKDGTLTVDNVDSVIDQGNRVLDAAIAARNYPLAAKLLERLEPTIDNQRPVNSILNHWGCIYMHHYDAGTLHEWVPPLGVTMSWDGYHEDTEKAFTVNYTFLGLDAWLSFSKVDSKNRPDPDYAYEHLPGDDATYGIYEQLLRYVDGGPATTVPWTLPEYIDHSDGEECQEEDWEEW